MTATEDYLAQQRHLEDCYADMITALVEYRQGNVPANRVDSYWVCAVYLYESPLYHFNFLWDQKDVDPLTQLATERGFGIVWHLAHPYAHLTQPELAIQAALVLTHSGSEPKESAQAIPDQPPADAEPNQIRRTILKQLYAVYFKDPSASVDRETLAALTSTDIVTLLPHVKLLELEDWLKCRDFYGGDYYTQITASGIRLVENAAEFHRVFPVQTESEESHG